MHLDDNKPNKEDEEVQLHSRSVNGGHSQGNLEWTGIYGAAGPNYFVFSEPFQ